VSEFSESFHLVATKASEAVDLMLRAKVDGFVFPPKKKDKLVTFVCQREGDAHDRLVAANTGVLIRYEHHPDHGGSEVEVFQDTRLVARWRKKIFDADDFVALGLLTAKAAGALSASTAKEKHAVAKALGLPRYAWLSYEYQLADDVDEPGRIEVDFRKEERKEKLSASSR
jgi:hypothetical protein